MHTNNGNVNVSIKLLHSQIPSTAMQFDHAAPGVKSRTCCPRCLQFEHPYSPLNCVVLYKAALAGKSARANNSRALQVTSPYSSVVTVTPVCNIDSVVHVSANTRLAHTSCGSCSSSINGVRHSKIGGFLMAHQIPANNMYSREPLHVCTVVGTCT